MKTPKNLSVGFPKSAFHGGNLCCVGRGAFIPDSTHAQPSCHHRIVLHFDRAWLPALNSLRSRYLPRKVFMNSKSFPLSSHRRSATMPYTLLTGGVCLMMVLCLLSAESGDAFFFGKAQSKEEQVRSGTLLLKHYTTHVAFLAHIASGTCPI
jgi:hypothetical protein